jgi:hypothetical protein
MFSGKRHGKCFNQFEMKQPLEIVIELGRALFKSLTTARLEPGTPRALSTSRITQYIPQPNEMLWAA